MSTDRKQRRLHTVTPKAKPVGPSLALVKKALRLFRGRGISKETRHRHARAWLKANASLGDGSLLKGATPRWGVPGAPSGPGVSQVYAPRRLSTGAK